MGFFESITDLAKESLKESAMDTAYSILGDQYKEIIVPDEFDKHTVVAAGLLKNTNNGRGNNFGGSAGVITNGSVIFVPEKTAAFVFSQGGIENVITESGGYVYKDGEDSVFSALDKTGESISETLGNTAKSVFTQGLDRISFGGITSTEKRVSYVNLREIRDIKFGTRGPVIYNDLYYGVDLEVYSYGSFSIRVTDPVVFIQNFVPANVSYYSFDDEEVRAQISAEFLQSFITALNALSTKYRASHIPSHSGEITEVILKDPQYAGTWEERFGFTLANVGIENLELSDESKELINHYSRNRMDVKAYDEISQQASNIAAQQKIAEGIKENGMGDMGGMVFGMNMVNGMNTVAAPTQQDSSSNIEKQIEMLEKLKSLRDAGILTDEEFAKKKNEIMNM